MEGADLLVQFFRGIGAAREAESYYALFRRTPPGRFAVLDLDPETSAAGVGLLVSQVALLAEVGLPPLLLVADDDAERRDALRETLLGALRLAEVEPRDLSDLFEEGTPRAFVRRVFAACRRRAVPLVATDDPEDRFALVEALRPRKYVRIAEAGGIRDRSGEVLDYLDIEEATLLPSVRDADIPFVRAADRILGLLGPRGAVQVASPGLLLAELFLVRGAGTYIRRARRIVVVRDLSRVSKTRLRRLIENAFEGRLVRDYFVRCDLPPVAAVFLDPSYRAAAVVRRVGRLAYLDKFAVRRIARGEGLGYDLWREILARFPRIFWRSRPENPVNRWYAKIADGFHRAGTWTVWWKGLPATAVPRAVRTACRIPATVLREEDESPSVSP